jgi:hypothetical protein
LTEIRFQLQQTPDGKWRLKERMNNRANDRSDRDNWQDRGLYESPAKGEEAIHRILHPTILNYNTYGEKI